MCIRDRNRAVKSTDDPWINDDIRNVVERRRKEYRENGRSPRWHWLKGVGLEKMAVQKKNYYKRECDRMTERGAHKMSFMALKNINRPDSDTRWTILELYPDLDERQTLEKLADYFNKISSEFVNLEEHDLIKTWEREISEISEAMILERVGNMKRPKSSVPGDSHPI